MSSRVPPRRARELGGDVWVESLVVLELGALLPSWIDDRAGLESNVKILVQRSDESHREFEARALHSVESIDDADVPRTCVLVAASTACPERIAGRTTLLRAMTALRQRCGRGDVVLASRGDARTERGLVALVRSSSGGAPPFVTLRVDDSTRRRVDRAATAEHRHVA